MNDINKLLKSFCFGVIQLIRLVFKRLLKGVLLVFKGCFNAVEGVADRIKNFAQLDLKLSDVKRFPDGICNVNKEHNKNSDEYEPHCFNI